MFIWLQPNEKSLLLCYHTSYIFPSVSVEHCGSQTVCILWFKNQWLKSIICPAWPFVWRQGIHVCLSLLV